MDDLRRVLVARLIDLAAGADLRDRADAGRALAVFADRDDAGKPLLALVLDHRDTWVTRVTALALLRRQDAAGLAIVARALALADDDQADWIRGAAQEVFGVYGRERDAAVRVCATLSADPDDRVRAGSRELATALADLDPVLLPVDGEQNPLTP